MRYGVQHFNGKGDVYRTRMFSTAKRAMQRAPWIMPYGNDKPNPDRWRVVEIVGTLDNPEVGETLLEPSKRPA